MRLWVKTMRALALALLIPIGSYLAAAGLLSHIPAYSDWHEPAEGITIYVETNGVHSGLILPANAAGVDWSHRVHPEDTPGQPAPRWLAFGWGNRDFYINTPTWAQFKWRYAFAAATGQGDTLIHVDLLPSVAPSHDVRPVRVSVAQYHALAAYIDATFADHREVIHGYGADDVFYAARGQYSIFRTCNVWTGGALKAAGVKTALWSPFDDGVLRWLR